MSDNTPASTRLTSPGIRDCFEPGSVIECTTCFDKKLSGEILAYDSQKKMLVLSILLYLLKLIF